MKVYEFVLPCYMFIGNKKISLNLNWYRNAHFQKLNATKATYAPVKLSLFKASKIKVGYTLVWNNNRRTDFMNWIAIADKYFLDWLVSMNCIPDDDIKHYAGNTVSARVDTLEKESYVIAEVTVIE